MMKRSEIAQHNEYLLNELEAEMAHLQELRDKRQEVQGEEKFIEDDLSISGIMCNF
jgi:hypothetical protein